MSDRTPAELVDALQVAYIRALDRKDLVAWLACFSPEQSHYECTTAESESQGLDLPIMLDDNFGRLKDRVVYVTEVWAGTFTDYAMRHFVQRTSLSPVGGDVYRAETNFLVAYTTDRRNTEILVAGHYEDDILIRNGRALFVKKRAILDTITTPRYLVYPI